MSPTVILLGLCCLLPMAAHAFGGKEAGDRVMGLAIVALPVIVVAHVALAWVTR